MYIFIVSVLCAVMLATVRQMVYPDLFENAIVALLLFVAIDTGLRAIMNEPSWMVKVLKEKRPRQKRNRPTIA